MWNIDAPHVPSSASAFRGPDFGIGTNTVVVVSDDLALRRSLITALDGAGFCTLQRSASELDSLGTGDADCAILDFHAGAQGGLALLRSLRREQPSLPAIFVAPRTDVRTAVDAFHAGAQDFIEYLRSDVDLSEVVETACAQGARLRLDSDRAADARRALARLSPRERDVFRELVAGSANKIIAKRLGISPRTVEIHRTHLMRKLAVKSVAQLVHLAQFDPPLAVAA